MNAARSRDDRSSHDLPAQLRDVPAAGGRQGPVGAGGRRGIARNSGGRDAGVVGESGSGKTTARPPRHPAGGTDAEARSGSRAKPTGNLGRQALKAYRRSVQMIFQNPYEALDPRFTIGDAVAEPLALHGIGTRQGAARQGGCRPRCGRAAAGAMSSRSASPPICRAANCSAWRSRAHWFSSRGCSSRTSRSACSTCRFDPAS